MPSAPPPSRPADGDRDLDAGFVAQRGLDLAQLDAIAPDLDLVVDAAEVDERAPPARGRLTRSPVR